MSSSLPSGHVWVKLGVQQRKQEDRWRPGMHKLTAQEPHRPIGGLVVTDALSRTADPAVRRSADATAERRAKDPVDLLESYRTELNGYCYRLLGSVFEAQDAVQDTMVRAWRGLESLERPSSLRVWLYRVATNVCFNMITAGRRRALPMDLTGPWAETSVVGPSLPEHIWVEPIPDALLPPWSDADPAEHAVERDTVRVAFIAALQHLPPRQRAILILRDVLRWSAREVADLLDATVVSVNSALQRARATLAARRPEPGDVPTGLSGEQKAMLGRYLRAFENHDVDALVALLHHEATISMPPLPLWLRGRAATRSWWHGPGRDCRGSRLVTVRANRSPAFAVYRPAPSGEGHELFAIHVLELSRRGIDAIHMFVAPRLAGPFDLPGRRNFASISSSAEPGRRDAPRPGRTAPGAPAASVEVSGQPAALR
jgi:RNA polymerase sigma-70 factor, ECF subfamily